MFSITGLESYELRSDMTVLHAIKKLHSCDDSAAQQLNASSDGSGVGGPSHRRLWDTVYTITYRLATAAESADANALAASSAVGANSALPPAVSPLVRINMILYI